MPQVSIIIPVYNVATWIEETLISVERQTFTDFECIIVDDKSTDTTSNIIKEWIKKDYRFKFFQRKENGGLSAARNTGIDLSMGEYIAFLDGDDLWHPEFLSKLLNHINKKNAWIGYSKFAMFWDKTNIRKYLVWDNLFRTGNIWYDMLMITEFHICSWIGKAEIIKSVGYFDLNLRSAQDRDFLLRLLSTICESKPEKVCGLDEELLFYRQRRNSITYTKGYQTIKLEWGYMPQHLDHPAIPASIRRRGYSFLAFKMGVISLNLKEYRQALGWFMRAVRYDPLNINLLWLPLRKLWLRCKKAEYVDFGLSEPL